MLWLLLCTKFFWFCSFHSASDHIKSFQASLKFSCSSFLIAQQCSITFIYHSLFSHSSIDGHALDFQFLATTKRAAINIFVHVEPFPIFMISLGYSPRSSIAGSNSMHIFVALWAYSRFLFRMIGSAHSPTSNELMFQLSHIFSNIYHLPVLSCYPICA